MFNPFLLNEEERLKALELCASIKEQCDALLKQIDDYKKEANNGSRN